MRLLLAALLLLPTAAALDALPATLGALEGSVVVRARGVVRVAADAPVEAALAHAFAPAPVDLAVPDDAAWRGLPGAVEVRLRRADATRPLRVELDDGATGVVVEWPAARAVTLPPLAAAGALLAAGAARRR
ncbi:MAG TPA: hypothetical protein VNX21_06830 [Candidatus Thermoplasmatota archaeon]|nr:hypothetical protein [Candidatus Thermoplasmatota archaeon]